MTGLSDHPLRPDQGFRCGAARAAAGLSPAWSSRMRLSSGGVSASGRAPAAGIAAPVEWVEGAQPLLAASAVGQIDAGQVPSRVADVELAQVVPRRRHLVADALDRYGCVRAPERTLHVDVECRFELVAAEAGPGCIGAVDQALERSAPDAERAKDGPRHQPDQTS